MGEGGYIHAGYIFAQTIIHVWPIWSYLIFCLGGRNYDQIRWADKSTTSYDMLDFKSYMKNLTRKYLVTERHILKLRRHTFAIIKV